MRFLHKLALKKKEILKNKIALNKQIILENQRLEQFMLHG